jgi:hypothetical protein
MPPDTLERCYSCQHEACERCCDFWGRGDENVQAEGQFLEFCDEQAVEKGKRKKVAKCVVEIIEKHGEVEERGMR